MALPTGRSDREYKKFIERDDGQVVVATDIGGAYDSVNGVIDVNVSNPPQTSSSFSLISSAKTLTGSFADVGGEINVANKNFIHFRVTLNINSATDARFRLLSKGTSGGATECTMDHSVITGTNCSVAADDSYIEQDADADQVFLIRVPLDRSVNYLQLQSMTAGGTADATLDAVTYTLGD